MLRNDTVLFPVRTTPWYLPRRTLGCSAEGCKASQGAALFQAPNPPFGVVFTYYLADEIRSLKEQRLKREKPLAQAGEDTPFPGWEAVTAEALEDAPAIVLTVRDAAGNTVRHIEGPVQAGFQRVAWDLRYPDSGPWKAVEDPDPWSPPTGVLAAPGIYTVSLGRRVDGTLQDLGQRQTFEVVSIREPALPGSGQEDRVAFSRRVDELRRGAAGSVAALDELDRSVTAIKKTLLRSTAPEALYDDANAIGQRAKRLRDRLAGNDMRDGMGDPGPMSVGERIGFSTFGARNSAYGSTITQRRNVEIAERLFTEVRRELDRLEADFTALQERLDAAGVPWTPGRGVPIE
jgi:hypothetical protein